MPTHLLLLMRTAALLLAALVPLVVQAQTAAPSFQIAARGAYLPVATEQVRGTGYAGLGVRGYTQQGLTTSFFIDIGYYLTDLEDLDAGGAVANVGKDIVQGEIGVVRNFGSIRPELALVIGLIGYDEEVSSDDQSSLIGTRLGVGFTPAPDATRYQPWITLSGSYYGVPGQEGFFMVGGTVGIELLR